MTLHIFNPDHDLVLAAGNDHFTPPKAARDLYADLGFLPALWSNAGDLVLVADAEAAYERLRHIKGRTKGVQLVDRNTLQRVLASGTITSNQMDIAPWGWDKNVKELLAGIGVSEDVLPSDRWLEDVRTISSRQWMSQNILPELVSRLNNLCPSKFVGTSFVVQSTAQLHTLLQEHALVVVKAPWSSSGRGIRYIENKPDPSTEGWCANTIEKQGCITFEPYYNKIRDFGMEFNANADGSIDYLGLSIFKTSKRTYTGSLLATEGTKLEYLSQHIDVSIMKAVSETITTMLSALLLNKYVGPLGIDMMLVKQEGTNNLAIHPCVEINLRRTMGHVALSLSPSPLEPQRLMSIDHSRGAYHLRLHTLSDGLLNTSIARL